MSKITSEQLNKFIHEQENHASVRKCHECRGRGYYWLEGAPGRPENRLKCEDCNGTGKRDSASARVPDETTQIALNAYNKSLFAGSYGPDDGQPICHDYTLAMRAALEAVAPKPETEE